jgi:hypothetical protein
MKNLLKTVIIIGAVAYGVNFFKMLFFYSAADEYKQASRSVASETEKSDQCDSASRAKAQFQNDCAPVATLIGGWGPTAQAWCHCVAINFHVERFSNTDCLYPHIKDTTLSLYNNEEVTNRCGKL